MADDEKKEPKKDEFWETIELLIAILVGVYLIYRAFIYFPIAVNDFFIHHLGSDSLIRQFMADPSIYNLRRMAATSALVAFLFFAYYFSKFFIYALSLFFIIASIWLWRRINAMSAAEHAALTNPKSRDIEEDPGLKRWKKILEKVRSPNSSDWRLAILEADIILDELLDVSGYRGDTMGDKLKSVEPSDMLTLNDAWEAHKIRNAIAHQGENFTLTEREARRVVGLYEKVFREYKFI